MSRPAFRPVLAARRLPAVLAIILVSSLVLAVAQPPLPAGAAPTDVPQETWVTNGRVKTMLRVGARLYLAGYFTQVGPNTGHGVAVDATGLRNPAFPKVDGVVYTAVPDGGGGWYLGGSFGMVGTAFRKNAAQITAGGAVTDWNPRVEGAVYSLAYSPTLQEVFLGGEFTTVGAVSRTRLAAVTTGVGNLITGWAPAASAAVWTLALRGNDVLAGGDFATAGGATRSRLAALDTVTGTPTAWNPGASATVRALAVAPNGATVYAGGDFTTAGGATRSRLAALDTVTGTPTAWNPGASATVRALAVAPNGATVYAGGDFTTAGGVSRAALAAFDPTTGATTGWNPGAAACTRPTPEEAACTTTVASLSVSADSATVSAGGLFTVAGGAARNNLAAFSAATGVPTAWDPSPNATVRALAGSGTQFLVGGDLTSVNAPTRNRIAAIDAATGVLDANFRADANDFVQAIALSPDGTRLFLGGDFSKVGNKSRANLAAVDPVTGALDTLWNPGAKGGPVLAMTVSGSRLYVGGKFTTVAGANVPRLAAVDVVSGAVASTWRPAPDNWVATLVPSPDGTLIYAGGQFGVIGGRTQRFMAAIRTDTGTASSWAPSSTYPLLTQVLSPDGSRLYVGGAGYDFNGNRASAFNTALSGRPLWETRGDGNVQGLALSPAADVLYIGGHFSQQNFVARQHMAAVRTADGVLTPFAPNVNGTLGVWSVAVDATSLSIGGDFTLVATRMQQGYARFPSVGPTLAVNSGPPDGASSSTGPSAYGGTAAAPGSTVVAVKVSLDGAAATNGACTGCGTASATWSYAVPALAEGRHTFDFTAVDAGTVPSATVRRTFTVDLTPPALTVTGGPADGASVNDSTPIYSGSATDAGAVAAVQASVDGAAFAATGVNCTGCGTSSATWTWTPPTALVDGSHTVGFRVVDGAGLMTASSPATQAIVVDTVPPAFITLTASAGTLIATFSEPLLCSSVSKSDFTALVNGASRSIKTLVYTGVVDATIDLTLALPALQSGDTVAVTLKAPVTDQAGNSAPRPVTKTT